MSLDLLDATLGECSKDASLEVKEVLIRIAPAGLQVGLAAPRLLGIAEAIVANTEAADNPSSARLGLSCLAQRAILEGFVSA